MDRVMKLIKSTNWLKVDEFKYSFFNTCLTLGKLSKHVKPKFSSL